MVENPRLPTSFKGDQVTPFEQAYIRRLMSDTYLRDAARPGRQVLDVAPFWYNASYTGFNLSLNTQSALIETQADSDFVVSTIAMSARRVGTNTFDALPLMTLQITDQSTGKTWFNAPSMMRLVAGDQGMPAKMAAPRVIQPNAVLQLDVTPLNMINDNAWVSIAGNRIFYEAIQ